MPTLGDLVKKNTLPKQTQSSAPLKDPKPMAKTQVDKPAPVKPPANPDEFGAYLAMRLGIDPERITAALKDYETRIAPQTTPAVKPEKPVVADGRALHFRWVGESIPSDDHRDRNEDAWTVLPGVNALGVFDGITVATGAADASAQAKQLFKEKVASLADDDPTRLAAKLKGVLEEINQDFVARNAGAAGPHLATTASVGIITRVGSKPMLIYAAVGDSRIGIWRRAQSKYELAELEDGLLRLLLLPADKRPAWAAKLLESHGLAGDLRLSIQDVATLASVFDQSADPATNSPLAKALFAERNLVTQSLGSAGIHVHAGTIPLDAGDRILFASDGIHDNLTENELVARLSQTDFQECATGLVVRAHEISRSSSPRAKRDDLTAVVLEII